MNWKKYLLKFNRISNQPEMYSILINAWKDKPPADLINNNKNPMDNTEDDIIMNIVNKKFNLVTVDSELLILKSMSNCCLIFNYNLRGEHQKGYHQIMAPLYFGGYFK